MNEDYDEAARARTSSARVMRSVGVRMPLLSRYMNRRRQLSLQRYCSHDAVPFGAQ